MDDHPVLREMQRLGCGNSTQVDLAFQTYIFLCERSQLWDVSYRYCAELDAVVISAYRHRKKESTDQEIFVPISATAELTPDWLHRLPAAVGHLRVTLAFVDGGVIVTHELRQGLHPMSGARRRRVPDPAIMLADEVRQHVTAVNEKEGDVDNIEESYGEIEL